jgi:hypothetical protein
MIKTYISYIFNTLMILTIPVILVIAYCDDSKAKDIRDEIAPRFKIVKETAIEGFYYPATIYVDTETGVEYMRSPHGSFMVRLGK